jgi:hypothetical protein
MKLNRSPKPLSTTAARMLADAVFVALVAAAAAMALFWGAGVAHGQPPGGPHCMVSCPASDGGTWRASGTLVAKDAERGLVTTAWHVVRDSRGPYYVCLGGRCYPAQLVSDPAAELAALWIAAPPEEPAPVDLDEPRPGERLTIAGFGGGGPFRTAAGPMSGNLGEYISLGAPTRTVVCSARQGDSGGGVFDQSGRLRGVLWGQNSEGTRFICGAPLRRFLDRVWPNRPGRVIGHATPPPAAAADWQSGGGPTTYAGGAPGPRPGTDPAPALGATTAVAPATPLLAPPLRDGADVDRALTATLDQMQKSIETLRDEKVDRTEFQRAVAAAQERLAGLAVPSVPPLAETSTAPAAAPAPPAAAPAPPLRDGAKWDTIRTTIRTSVPLLGLLAIGAAATTGLGAPYVAWRIGMWALAGWRRRRGQSQPPAPSPQPHTQYVPIAVDAPPPEQQVVPRTHYVTVEGNAYANAHQWASEQVARKYPGGSELLTTLDSLIQQKLAANPR